MKQGGVAARYAHVFWDLDGTLTDSREGIVRSAAFALETLGRTVDAATLDRFAGPPLVRSFRTLCGLDGDELTQAVALYRDRYLRLGWRENRLMPGIEKLLRELGQTGVAMSVATVKPRPTALRILEHFALAPYFEALHAPDRYGLAVDKTDVLREGLGGHAWRGPGRAAMVGDHPDDVRAARTLGLDAIAVLYGYGGREALLEAEPAAAAADVCALRRLLLV